MYLSHNMASVSQTTVKDDFIIISEPTEISMGTREACLQLTATDDSVAEQDEVFTVMVQPLNPSDQVNGSTSIIITDNDGKPKHVLHNL